MSTSATPGARAAGGPAAPPGERSTTQSGEEGATLLLVEDSETQALQIRRALERQGYRVARAVSAEAALERLGDRLPDLIVSDYHLPGMNGGQLVRQLRLNARTRAIPVLMLTEAVEPGLEREGLESGADAYVPKSADQELIALRIRALLRQRALAPAARAEAGDEAAGGGGDEAFGPLFRRARILLVRPETDPALVGMLGRDGHEVETVPDAATARAALVREPDRDCIVFDLTAHYAAAAVDPIAFCAELDAGRQGALSARRTSYRILGLIDGTMAQEKEITARAYAVGVDDVVSAVAGLDAVGLRIRAVVRRKLLQDETARIETALRERQLAVENARAEAAASSAKAALAEALAQANGELAQAYDKLRDAQGKLVQAAKMASLGELVAGIAHEINNPLAFILAHQNTVDRLLEQVSAMTAPAPGVAASNDVAAKLAKARARVASMSLGLKRIQDLVLNLRKFSRLDESEYQTVDVPEAIDTVLSLLTHKLGSGITVERRYAAPRELTCQPALFNQVIMNILGNAADALAGASGEASGRIVIETSTQPRDDGEHYVIVIGDDGPGISEELRGRIFEPFFTTKPVGAGTGLGLAIAYSVVQAHEGQIVVDDMPDGGARFVVTVPIGRSRPAAERPPAPADGSGAAARSPA